MACSPYVQSVRNKRAQLWESFFCNPGDWWDIRHNKKSPTHPDFRHKVTREVLCLNDPRKPQWVDSRLAADIDDDKQVQLFFKQIQRQCSQGQLERALSQLIDHVHNHDVAIDVYLSILHACRKIKALLQVKHVHALLLEQNVRTSGILGDHLVAALANCGALEDAHYMLLALPHRTVYSWTAMIAGYTTWGRGQEALKMHRLMQEEGIEPDQHIFVSLFQACGNISDLQEAKKLHAEAQRKGFTSNVFVGSTLVSMYGKCGSISAAEHVFRGLTNHNVVTWTALLSAYVEGGEGEKGLQLYRQMVEEGLSPDQWTFTTTLQACGLLAEKGEIMLEVAQDAQKISMDIGRSLYADTFKKNFISDVFIFNAFVTLCGKCRGIVDAEDIFNNVPGRDVVSWSAMLSVYVEEGQGLKALHLFKQMQVEGVSPNKQTYVVAIQACGAFISEVDQSLSQTACAAYMLALEIGRALYGDGQRKGFVADAVGNAFISLFAKCNSIAEAEHVFDEMHERSVVSWNALLSAYVEQGEGRRPLQLYRQMQEEGLILDQQTLVIVLQACVVLLQEEGMIFSMEIGKALHFDAQRKGFLSDITVGNSILTMYSKCGNIMEAEHMFDGLPKHSTASWNAMMSAYVEHSQAEKALALYRQMIEEGVPLNDVTLLCALEVCRTTGSMDFCRELHFSVTFSGHDQYPLLGKALSQAYGYCACMEDAKAVFDRLPEHDPLAWMGSLLNHARGGKYIASLEMFEQMQPAGVTANKSIFLSLLSFCNQGGLVDNGVQLFESMSRDYGMLPDMRHFAALTDLLGRAGEFEKLEYMLSEMPVQENWAIWMSVLGACRTYGHVNLGKEAFDHAVRLKPKDAAAYVLMSDIYNGVGLYMFAKEIENLRLKQEGC